MPGVLQCVMEPGLRSAPSIARRTGSPTRAAGRDARTSAAHVRFTERHNVLLYLALLVGVAVGRRTASRLAGRSTKTTSEFDQGEHLRRPLGAASIAGRVRESNQDRVAVASIAGLDVISMADGLGGVPRGEEAAEIVHRYAMARLEAELPMVLVAGREGVRALLLQIIWGAGVELACVAARQTWAPGDPGLRSTLILVVASDDLYVAAWIGDGIVNIVRADGTTVCMLEPHKHLSTPDILEASLGPTTEGRPSWAIAPRYTGDLLVVATDGVGDRFDAELVERIEEALFMSQGDAVEASHAVVDGLAALADDDGDPALTDNLTIALLTTGGAAC